MWSAGCTPKSSSKITYFIGLTACAFRTEQRAVNLDVADIKELVVREPIRSSCTEVRLDVVQFPQLPSKSDVSLII